MTEVRTRFAPSPTGYMHIGNLRTALYAYLIAKKNNGKFILRIEDTDQERYVEGAIDVIYNTLKLVGLQHDEGPDIGGPYGPYVQSQRREIYSQYAKKLIDIGGAYYCFCSKERLDALRQECERKGIPFKYDGHCRNISREEAEERIKRGEQYVIRQKIPATGTTSFHDEVFGTITVSNDSLDDNILIKSDGMPTYNFANVVDDHLMKITHVVRGSEYLSSTPKYNLLYKAFGWEIPTYIHLPLIMKPHGGKLSKREGDASFEDFYNKGYLKEAIINYIALLGWSPGTDEEIFTLEELKQRFSIEGLSKSPAVFDINKLRWMNGEYIRSMSLEEFNELAMPYYKKAIKRQDIDYMKLSRLLQTRTEVLGEIPDNIDFIEELPDYDVNMYANKKMRTDLNNSLEYLKKAYEALQGVDKWDDEHIHEALFKLIAELGVKNGQVLWPVRTAVSGKQFTPGGAIELSSLLGKEETLRRIKIGIEKLSNV
ncbi:glutamate--tRNA ligase [Caldanaerobius polysaccharolyticus]|uniref:glutamate--tRNA ligase n=1 Tax=Caldanaerobius polysaccharolyticus TaxID=44256 RepID=UPI000479D79E|nr:glutamate--tRNA ligase [Caldanaerobius polysaccharolyticus]